MRGNDVMGLIFSNEHEERIRELTENRTVGSVPFGGRYRLIDFPLSSMVNSGISEVGVIARGNYQSLMDHLGSGKAWNLSRKREGLFVLPPFESGAASGPGRIGALASSLAFLRKSKEEYVLLMDCDTVCNIPFRELIARHVETGADITVVCRRGKIPEKMADPAVYDVAPDGEVRGMLVAPTARDECCYDLGILLIRRDLLMRFVSDCVSRNQYNFKRDLLQRNLSTCRVYAYEFRGFARTICSTVAYFDANMALMDPDVRAELFNPSRPVYTKVRDDMPARYGLGAEVSNSLVADGCVVEGRVENSVLFRGVHVGKGTVVRNCVILQDSIIGRDCRLNYVIMDKNVLIKNDRLLFGFQSYPVFIAKGSVV
ncbi:MAG TPA: glucose-1-phosphate adenylyltransferase subunit GlgD [Ruminococcaceae bacterium]|jgi:glucose-1-phosphate adenylyltransferase|nr:glucose-1-phosphate adenylyltransferase subunit GlgD [Oscillospiraceae bacterium]